MFQLQSSHHQAVYVRIIKRNHIPVVYIEIKMIKERHLGITHKGIQLLHTQKHLQHKRYFIQLNN
jgi:hypothetical protein